MKLKKLIIESKVIDGWIDINDRIPNEKEIKQKLLTWDEVNGFRLINASAAPKPKLPSDVKFWSIPKIPKT